MGISTPVRTYYAERIFARMGRDRVPPNFAPLPEAPTGFATVDGCRARGKNILEVALVARGTPATIEDIRIGCGLCNPAMYVAADLLCEWARGQGVDAVLAWDPLDPEVLPAFADALGVETLPEDAREKFQYGLFAVQNALRDHRGEAPREVPDIPAQGAWGDA